MALIIAVVSVTGLLYVAKWLQIDRQSPVFFLLFGC
jgi:hypothetical protein